MEYELLFVISRRVHVQGSLPLRLPSPSSLLHRGPRLSEPTPPPNQVDPATTTIAEGYERHYDHGDTAALVVTHYHDDHDVTAWYLFIWNRFQSYPTLESIVYQNF